MDDRTDAAYVLTEDIEMTCPRAEGGPFQNSISTLYPLALECILIRLLELLWWQ